jgi:tetratricopeptide (TPR) repeat protein
VKAAHRRELKHDEFVDSVLGSVAWVKKQLAPHKRVFMGVGIGLLVAVLAYAGVEAFDKRQSRNAWNAFEAEKAREMKGEGHVDYSKLLQRFEGNRTEAWFLYYSALDSVEEVGRAADDKAKGAAREKAIAALERLRAKYPKHPLVERSTALLAQQYADTGQWQKAAATYRVAVNSKSEYVDDFLRQKATFGLAYTHEVQGNVQEAKKLYVDLKSFKDSIWGDMASFRLERLSASNR